MDENQYRVKMIETQKAAYDVKDAAETEARAAYDNVMADWQARIDAAMAEESRLTALFENEQRRLDTEKAAAVQDPRIGKIYHEWTKGSWGSGPWRETEKLGVVEVVSPQRPLRFRSFRSGRPGDLCIRELIKKGGPGIWAHAFRGDDPPYGWFPEGVTPRG